MEFVGLDLDDLGMAEGKGNSFNLDIPTLENIIPREGLFLGLDISKNSTGITVIENGERVTGNIRLEDTKGEHKEVLLRRALKNDLKEVVCGKEFDLIIIEDAFIGENAETVRMLFALNTAIDEMILDGECTCKKFFRVSNQTWKSWLYMLDPSGVTKGYNDKEKIRYCLESIGVYEEGEGYQDRLDSTGLLVGYFLKGKEVIKKHGGTLEKKRKVRMSDIEASYEIDSSFLFYGRDDIDRSKVEFLDYRRISKSRVVELLTENPDKVFVTDNRIILGNLGIDLGLDIIDEGGYFAFWVNPKRKRKYLEIEKK